MSKSEIKKVQHPTGGIVGELRVTNGVRVARGQVLVKLDETTTRAGLAIVQSGIDEARARQARLTAERDGDQAVRFPEELLARTDGADIERLIDGERKLFEIRRKARSGQVAQLREQIGQLREQEQGLRQQLAAKKREIELIEKELTGVRELWRQNLVAIQRVTALERDAARLEGESGMLVSNIAQTAGRVTETELQILQIDQDLRTEVAKELAEIRAKLSELAERKVTAQDQLKRVEHRRSAGRDRASTRRAHRGRCRQRRRGDHADRSRS